MTTDQNGRLESPAIPSWPRVHAVVEAGGRGAVTIDGTTTLIAEPDILAARTAITNAATAYARSLGHPVRMSSTDPDGQWALIVAPDGQVALDGTPEPIAGPESAGSEPEEAVSQDDASQDDEPQDDEPVARHAAEEDEPAAEPSSAPSAAEEEPVPARAWSEPEAPTSAVGVAAANGQPAPAWPPQRSAAAPQPDRSLPTLDDLLDSRPTPPPGPAEWGWRGAMRRMSLGLIHPDPSAAELQHRSDVAAVQRSLAGPRTIVVVNPKGGAHKTTATMLIAATFGRHRGGYTLAWDNNETRGTLGWRAVPARHTNTAVNLLADLERFDDPTRARIGDLDNYVRSQGSAQFDVLASDEDAGASASIGADAFRRLHAALSRFYRIMVIDTGNNMRASNWGAAIEAADQLVIVSTVREDTAASAAWLVDGLRSRLFEKKVEQAVMLLSSPGLQPDPGLQARLHHHFSQLTRAVINVPYDPALVDGAAIEFARLQPSTREAWLHATAVIAEGL